MLRKFRILFASIFFVALTLLFLDFTGLAHSYLGWLAKLQFIPALLSANLIVVLVLVLVTLLFGRIYCSVICPLGIFQDIVAALKKKRNKYEYSKPMVRTRLAFLVAFVAVCTCGFMQVASLIAPYSAYGRIASNFFAPIWRFSNNLLSYICERFDSYAFYPVEVWFKGVGVFVVSIITLALIIVLAWRGGRTYCNTICPVGTLLGFVSKFSIFRPVIDKSKCISCGLCTRNCKAKCINAKEHKIDYSRCVACFDCLEHCHSGAISYAPRFFSSKAEKKSEQKGNETGTSVASYKKEKVESVSGFARRGFFASLLFFASGRTVQAQENKLQIKVDGGLAPLKLRRKPPRKFRILPAGAKSESNFARHCTSCQLCVSVCKYNVLTPSSSLATLMQPELSFERGYCPTDCVACSTVCPTGAITPVDVAQKSSTQIGRASVNLDLCAVNADGMQCDNCFRHCPTAAIQMVSKNPKDAKSLKIPVVDEARCIGCGACENLCPARPIAAIRVEGNTIHREI